MSERGFPIESRLIGVPPDGQVEPPEQAVAPSVEASPGLRRQSPVDWLERLNSILEVADEEESLAAELASLVGEMLSGRGLVLLCDGSRPQVARSYRMDREQSGDISYSLIEEVRRVQKPYLCPDIRTDSHLNRLRSIRASAALSVICYPVISDQQCLGVIYVDHHEAGKVCTSEAVAAIEKLTALTGRLLQSIIRRRKQVTGEPTDFELVGESEPMMRLMRQLRTLAQSTDPDLVILLLGETGTGKSRAARELYNHQNPHRGSFRQVNCAAISPNLFESEFFGHVRGAFTSAVQDKKGVFELGSGGLLFLDEIGEIPLDLQAKLLSVLQEREFTRIGAPHHKLKFESQLVCATSRDLRLEVENGRFRADLLRRVYVNVVTVPPLRERGPGDIRLLARHQIHKYLVEHRLLEAGAPLAPLESFLTRQAEQILCQYDWPWNVGELENLFRNELIRSHLRTLGQEKVGSRQVEDVLGIRAPRVPRGSSPDPHRGRSFQIPPELTLRQLNEWWIGERAKHIGALYRACGGNASEVARRLECTRDMVHRTLKETRESD